MLAIKTSRVSQTFEVFKEYPQILSPEIIL